MGFTSLFPLQLYLKTNFTFAATKYFVKLSLSRLMYNLWCGSQARGIASRAQRRRAKLRRKGARVMLVSVGITHGLDVYAYTFFPALTRSFSRTQEINPLCGHGSRLQERPHRFDPGTTLHFGLGNDFTRGGRTWKDKTPESKYVATRSPGTCLRKQQYAYIVH